jgi:hypothetical protein
MKITRVRTSGRHRPPCEAKVKLTDPPSRETQNRIAASRRNGRPADQCGRAGVYLVDGAPMCPNHAGQMAVKHIVAGQA